jgi:hypothetical protein
MQSVISEVELTDDKEVFVRSISYSNMKIIKLYYL